MMKLNTLSYLGLASLWTVACASSSGTPTQPKPSFEFMSAFKVGAKVHFNSYSGYKKAYNTPEGLKISKIEGDMVTLLGHGRVPKSQLQPVIAVGMAVRSRYSTGQGERHKRGRSPTFNWLGTIEKVNPDRTVDILFYKDKILQKFLDVYKYDVKPLPDVVYIKVVNINKAIADGKVYAPLKTLTHKVRDLRWKHGSAKHVYGMRCGQHPSETEYYSIILSGNSAGLPKALGSDVNYEQGGIVEMWIHHSYIQTVSVEEIGKGIELREQQREEREKREVMKKQRALDVSPTTRNRQTRKGFGRSRYQGARMFNLGEPDDADLCHARDY